MNIIDKCAAGYWKQNKLKFIPVMICTTLSVALLMSLFVSFKVFFDSRVSSKKDIYGDYMIKICGVGADESRLITESDSVESSFSASPVGFSEISTENPYKRYLFILNADSGFMNKMPIRLLSGHLPQTPDEIILPHHMGSVYKIGDTPELTLGDRTDNTGNIPVYSQYREGEYLEPTGHHTYKVVGFYERAVFEDTLFPAFIAITGGKTDLTAGPADHYVTLKSPYLARSFQKSFSRFECEPNGELLSCYGIGSDYRKPDIAQLFTLLTVLLIIVVSALLFVLNKNIIYISLGENRRKLYARLHLLGTLRRQFYLSSLKEAIIITAAAIPLAFIIGLFVSSKILSALSELTSVEMRQSSGRITFLLISAGIVFIFVLTAYLLFIKNYDKNKAGRRSSEKKYRPLSAAGAVRDISEKYMKNNKKRTNSIIVSISVCVFMFISFTCVCNNMRSANERFKDSIESDIRFDYYDYHLNYADPVELFRKLKNFHGITDGNCVFSIDDGSADISGNDYRSRIYVFDDDYFRSSFPGENPVAFFNGVDLVKDRAEGVFTFKRFVPVGDVDPFAENQKFRTEERTFSVDFSADVREYRKYLGADLADYDLTIIYPYSVFDGILSGYDYKSVAKLYFDSDSPDDTYKEMYDFFSDNGYSAEFLVNNTALLREEQNNYYLIRFFSTIFTVFIFVIATFNLVNITLSSIRSRIPDYIVMYSLGTQKRDIQKMSVSENISCQLKGIAISSLPTVAVSVWSYFFINSQGSISPYIPVKELMTVLLVFMLTDIITVILSIHLLEKDKIVGYLKEMNL